MADKALSLTGSRQRPRTAALSAIDQTRLTDRVLLSAISVWEISHLLAKQRIVLDQPLGTWVRQFVTAKGFDAVSFTVPMAIEASSLPSRELKDPADRFLVATARHLDVPLVTRDKRILKFAEAGHVQVIAC